MDSADETAINKARRGDRDAFRTLVDRHARAVYHLAFRMTGNPSDAEDMVQETFLKAWKQIGKFDGRASFGTWLHRICANCSLDFIRVRKRKQESQDPEESLTRVQSPGPSPERLTQSSQITAMLMPALNQLSDMERSAFILRHYDGMAIEDIAGALNVQPGAARHSVFRAVQKLRRALEPARSAAQ